MKYSRRSRIGWGLAALSLCLLWWLVPPSWERQSRAVVLVESRTHYRLALADGTEVDFLPPMADSTLAVDAEMQRTTTGFLIAADGRLITSAAAIAQLPDSLCGEALQVALQARRECLQRRRTTLKANQKELEYYARTHTITDDGYNDVMEWRYRTEVDIRRTDSLLQRLEAALALPAAVAYRQNTFRVVQTVPTTGDSVQTSACSATLLGAVGEDLLLLRLRGEALPESATTISTLSALPALLTPARAPRRVVTFFQTAADDTTDGYLPPTVAELSDSGSHLLPTEAEGSPVFNRMGQLTGVIANGKCLSARKLWRISGKGEPWLKAKAAAVKRWWHRLPADTAACRRPSAEWRPNVAGRWTPGREIQHRELSAATYYGYVKNGKPEGFGVALLANGSRYEGYWKSGLRSGFGALRDTAGVEFRGMWELDTLRRGVAVSGTYVYAGSFDDRFRPHGFGIVYSCDATFCYLGEWNYGLREGHGFGMSTGKLVQCGHWSGGIYKGEQMRYTADRVYGIDISRYQHEIGKKKYNIDWKKLRITSLGSSNSGRIVGRADYPVSYVYIKSTQGVTIRNRYYPADLRQARAHGLPVGAYHFFSTNRSGAAQADFFLKHSGIRRGDLPPMLDVEPSEAQISQMGGDKALFREVLAFLRAVERACGVRPVLYVGQQFVNRHIPNAPDELTDYDVWVARYGQYRPYVHLLHWQLSPHGRVTGIRGEVDINVFNGTKEQFREYLRTHCVK